MNIIVNYSEIPNRKLLELK